MSDINSLETIFLQLQTMSSTLKVTCIEDETNYINKLQDITSELSSIFRTFGTEDIEDLLSVCYGSDFIKNNFVSPNTIERFKVMKEHIHPIGYKITSWKADTQQNLKIKNL